MNERIRELMLEAGYAAPELATRAQKLVTLVIDEHIKLADDEMSRFYNLDEPWLARAMENYIELVIEHFRANP